jgi:hypothetical protein
MRIVAFITQASVIDQIRTHRRTRAAHATHPGAKRGILYGKSELSDHGGFNLDLDNANHEGGPRNGVLTAIEDFFKEHGSNYYFFMIEKEYGLGFLIRRDAPAFVILKYRLKATYLNIKEKAKLRLGYRH